MNFSEIGRQWPEENWIEGRRIADYLAEQNYSGAWEAKIADLVRFYHGSGLSLKGVLLDLQKRNLGLGEAFGVDLTPFLSTDAQLFEYLSNLTAMMFEVGPNLFGDLDTAIMRALLFDHLVMGTSMVLIGLAAGYFNDDTKISNWQDVVYDDQMGRQQRLKMMMPYDQVDYLRSGLVWVETIDDKKILMGERLLKYKDAWLLRVRCFLSDLEAGIGRYNEKRDWMDEYRDLRHIILVDSQFSHASLPEIPSEEGVILLGMASLPEIALEKSDMAMDALVVEELRHINVARRFPGWSSNILNEMIAGWDELEYLRLKGVPIEDMERAEMDLERYYSYLKGEVSFGFLNEFEDMRAQFDLIRDGDFWEKIFKAYGY